MKFDPKEVADGLHDGKIVWICDYLYDSILDIPHRNVLPTRVIITACPPIPAHRECKSYFSIMKGDDAGQTVIKLYDSSGRPVKIFSDRDKCEKEYIKMCEKNLRDIDNQLEKIKALRDKVVIEIKKNMEKAKL